MSMPYMVYIKERVGVSATTPSADEVSFSFSFSDFQPVHPTLYIVVVQSLAKCHEASSSKACELNAIVLY